MSNQEILEKAIQKAIDGGWHLVTNGGFYLVNGEVKFEVGFIDLPRFPIERIIFNHDFARALWGVEDADGQHYYAIDNSYQIETPNWQHHLIQMVIADDPIKYLGANI